MYFPLRFYKEEKKNCVSFISHQIYFHLNHLRGDKGADEVIVDE